MAIKIGPINLVTPGDEKAMKQKAQQNKAETNKQPNLAFGQKTGQPNPNSKQGNNSQIIGIVLMVLGIILLGIAILTW